MICINVCICKETKSIEEIEQNLVRKIEKGTKKIFIGAQYRPRQKLEI